MSAAPFVVSPEQREVFSRHYGLFVRQAQELASSPADLLRRLMELESQREGAPVAPSKEKSSYQQAVQIRDDTATWAEFSARSGWTQDEFEDATWRRNTGRQ